MIVIKNKRYIKLILFLLLFSFVFSCKEDKISRYRFVLDKSQSHISNDKFILDSIIIIYGDSIYLRKYNNGDYLMKIFYIHDNSIYERRLSCNDSGEDCKYDSILTFDQQDTIFEYKSLRELYLTTIDMSYGSSFYKITNIDNMCITEIQSMYDSTYKEIYYYDKNYNVIKIKNLFKDNICVYERDW